MLVSRHYKVANPHDILDNWTQDQLNDAHDVMDYLEKLESRSAPKPRPRRT